MQSFGDLVKAKNKFCWNATLDKLYSDSKSLLISKVQEAVKILDINKHIFLQTDWSRGEIEYLLLQQHCPCLPTNPQTCCPDGWRLVLVAPETPLKQRVKMHLQKRNA